MKRSFSKKISKGIRGFGGISKKRIPYAGIKHASKKGHSQSLTISPLRKTFYTKTNVKNIDLKTKTNMDTGLTKFKIKKK